MAEKVDGKIPATPSMYGWEGQEDYVQRVEIAAYLGSGVFVSLVMFEVGRWMLDRGSQEATMGLLRPKFVWREGDVWVSKHARIVRLVDSTRAVLRAWFYATIFVIFSLLLPFSGENNARLALLLITLGVFVRFLLVPHRVTHLHLSKKWKVLFAFSRTWSVTLTAAGGGALAFGLFTLNYTEFTGSYLEFGYWITIGYVLLALASVPPRVAKRLSQGAIRKVFDEDARAEILLLRSPQDDHLRQWVRPFIAESTVEGLGMADEGGFDELLAWMARREGSVTAIGEPYAELSTLIAATELQIEDEAEWKQAVIDHLQSAAAVIVVPHVSHNGRWVLEQVVEQGAVGKTLFVFPPLSGPATVDRVALTSIILGLSFQETYSSVLRGAKPLVALALDARGRAFRYFADGRDSVAYALALLHAVPRAKKARYLHVTPTNHHFGDEAAEETKSIMIEPLEEKLSWAHNEGAKPQTIDPFQRGGWLLARLLDSVGGRFFGRS